MNLWQYTNINFIIPFVLAIVISVILTKLIYEHYRKQNFVDIPGGRNLHDSPIVTGGGISIVILNIIALIYYNFSIIFIFPIIVISVLGFIDDKVDLSPLIRILTHFSCAFCILIWLGNFPVLDFGIVVIENVYFRNLFGIVFISWFINLYNFMDGSDGFATFQSIFISLSFIVFLLFLYYMQYVSTEILPTGFNYKLYAQGVQEHHWVMTFENVLRLLIINVSVSIGFLFFNYPNAKIFMGDQGSNFLGLYLISIGLYIVYHLPQVSIWTILIAYGLFFVDSTITLFRRFFKRQKWYLPHRSHCYQRFIISKQKTIPRKQAHQKLLMYSSLINYLWLLPMSIFSVILVEYSFLIFLLSSMPLVYLSLYKYNEEFEV
tara:strand:- start:290 stop:1420 length:1131 start_codon:yes stop_codon:yes gene_type:complete